MSRVASQMTKMSQVTPEKNELFEAKRRSIGEKLTVLGHTVIILLQVAVQKKNRERNDLEQYQRIFNKIQQRSRAITIQ